MTRTCSALLAGILCVITASCGFPAVSVGQTNNAPVFVSKLPDTTIAQDQSLTFACLAKDIDKDVVSFSLDNPPTGATITNLGIFTWKPTPSQGGRFQIAVVITDGVLKTVDRAIVTVTGANVRPPFVIRLPDTTVYQAQELGFRYHATDPKNDTLVFRLLDPPPGAAITSSGYFSWKPGYSQKGEFAIVALVAKTDYSDTARSTVTVSTDTVSPARIKDEVHRIYGQLEIKSYAGAKFAERWMITDWGFAKNLLDVLANKGALTKDFVVLQESKKEELAKNLQDGKVFFVCTRRIFDDQIQSLAIVPERGIDPIEDWVFLNHVLGDANYSNLKGRSYSYKNLTVVNHKAEQWGKHEMYLHGTDPEVMFWSTAADSTGRWFLSAFGKFGYDNIDLPFWFRGSVVGGVRLRHRDETCRNGRQYDKWSIYLGWEQPMDYSIPEGTMLDQMFKSRKLMSSAAGIYFKTTYSWDLKKDTSDIEFGIEGSIAMMEKGKGGFYSNAPDQFYTTRNYASALLKFNRLIGFLDVGGGVSWHDLSHVSRISDDYHLRHIEATRNVLMPYLEVGISESGDLLQYALNAQINYNVNMGYGYFVFKSQFMVSNAFGLEFKYFNSLSPFNVPPWQYDNYIVFSPIIRINF